MAAAMSAEGMTVDELARQVDVPVRTIREYQAMGLLPPPVKRGRVGLYGATHRGRLELIARLQLRGYSLAGIRDLLTSWQRGVELPEILGLDPDQLVHLDEPGATADLAQLTRALPALVPDHLDDLLAAGILERCGPDGYCVNSPSLLQLTADTLAAGYPPERVVEFLMAVHEGSELIAGAAADLLTDPPATLTQKRQAELAARGRGLLAHGTGRLTIYTLARRLGIDHGTPESLRKALRGGR
jgi:DNA-binding transcriptional MerR regulator